MVEGVDVAVDGAGDLIEEDILVAVDGATGKALIDDTRVLAAPVTLDDATGARRTTDAVPHPAGGGMGLLGSTQDSHGAIEWGRHDQPRVIVGGADARAIRGG